MSEYSLEGASIKLALLALEDGVQLHGRAIGATDLAVGEVVFNTSMTDYQEILTDPFYPRQTVTLTYPHADNVGTNNAGEESFQAHAQDLVTRDLPLTTSNLRNTEDFSSYLKCHNIATIADIDTRKLMRLLREKGVQNGCIITDGNPDVVLALEKARTSLGLNGMDLTKEITTTELYSWTQGSWILTDGLSEAKKEDEPPYHVMAYDFDAKRNVLRTLVDRSCRLTIVPAQTSAEDVLGMNPDSIFLSNGLSDPIPCDYTITAIQKFLETGTSVFGIRLGHQPLALASDAKTVKMKSGHHGGDRSVKDIEKDVVIITAQNYGLAVDEATLPANLCVMHKSLFDGTLQGVHRIDKSALSFQRHPEASLGPHDAAPLSDHFVALVEQYRRTTK